MKRLLIITGLLFLLLSVPVLIALPGPSFQHQCQNYGIGHVRAEIGSTVNKLETFAREHGSVFPCAPKAIDATVLLSLPSKDKFVWPYDCKVYYLGDTHSYELWVPINHGRGCDGDSETGDNYLCYSSRSGVMMMSRTAPPLPE